jgi:hypothetical protein
MRNGRFHPSKWRGKVQKLGVLYTLSPKMPGPSPNFLIIPKKIKLNFKSWKKGGRQGDQPIICHTTGCSRPATNSCPPPLHKCPKLPPCKIPLLHPIHIFGHMWSTLVSWLQHLPALPWLFLKFSLQFLICKSKIMKFALMQSLFRGAYSQKVSKNLLKNEIKWRYPNSHLSLVGVHNNSLWVKFCNCKHK